MWAAANLKRLLLHVSSRERVSRLYSLTCSSCIGSRVFPTLRPLQLLSTRHFCPAAVCANHSEANLSPASSTFKYCQLSSSTKDLKLDGSTMETSSLLEEKVGLESLKGDAQVLPRQRKYIRKDNLKWQKSPWKVKQLRFTRHIMNLVRKGKIDEAHKVFQQMKRGKVHPDAAVYNTLIAGYGRKGNVQACFRLFNEMKKRSILPTDHTYSSLFASCAEVGPKASTVLDKVQEEVERRSVLLNNVSTNALITALASCGRHDDAMGIYLEMINRKMMPDLHTFGSLLLAASNNDSNGFEVAQRVWLEMIASGLDPDLHCFNILLQCLRDGGVSSTIVERVEEKRRAALNVALNLDETFTPSRFHGGVKDIDLWVNGAVSFTLGQGSRLRVHLGHVEGRRQLSPLRWLEEEDVELFFSLFKKLRLRPDIRTFHLLAHLCLDPSRLMKEMNRRKVLPDSRFMVAAIKMQASLGNVTGAKNMLEYSNKADLELNQAGYQAIATSCHSMKDGIKLLNEMISHHLTPNEYVFGTLIGNAARSRSYEYLTALIKKMLHFEVIPNDTILEILEAAAANKPKNSREARRLNGFKGYHKIWKKLMVADDDDNNDELDYGDGRIN